MTEEVFEIFDEDNQLIGTAPRSEVHRKGLYHRAVNVFIVNSQGYIFLQKRSEKKDTSPGYWCYGAGEHLKPGESYIDGALRGLKEELGLENANAIELRGPKLFHLEHENGIVDNEFDALYVVVSDGPFHLDKEEVSECMFFKPDEIDRYIEDGTMDFTKVFLLEWPEFKKYYLDA